MGFDRHATLTERARTVHARLRADPDDRHYSGKLRRRWIAEAYPKGTAGNGS